MTTENAEHYKEHKFSCLDRLLKKYYASVPHTVVIKKHKLALYLCLGKTHTRNQ